jgi:hypothetical protein
MRRKYITQTTAMLKHLDKVADQHKYLIDKISLALEDGDTEKASALMSELLKFRPTVLSVTEQAEAYRDMLLQKRKRSQKLEQLKNKVN